MQWDDSAQAGFCPPSVEPWLPVADASGGTNVAAQEGDPDSILALYRRLLALRRRSPALRAGRYRQVGSSSTVFLYLREQGEERMLVALSFGSIPIEVPVWPGTVEVGTSVAREGERVGRTCLLEPAEGLVIRLD